MPELLSSDTLVAQLCRPEAYPHEVTEVELLETHISWVFLAGEYAYKVKKPVRNNFLDYSTLERREHFCREELRLDRRFAPSLYLDVVAIVYSEDAGAQVSAAGDPIEYAVQMQRFPSEALLSKQVEAGSISAAEVRELAETIAHFHQQAASLAEPRPFGEPQVILDEALANIDDLQAANLPELQVLLEQLHEWTVDFFQMQRRKLQARKEAGAVRECHGDLHLGNVVHWQGAWMPFDGIEFSEEFRWIDTLSDAAFTAMDFAARGHRDHCHSFTNAYLEATGEYQWLDLWRWYLVYRALVRAKVAGLRLNQLPPQSSEHQSVRETVRELVQLADSFTRPTVAPQNVSQNGSAPLRTYPDAGQNRSSPKGQPPLETRSQLWITHGLSGSGKTTHTEQVVRDEGAIRLRSDVERKRMREHNIGPSVPRPYSNEETRRTYDQLVTLSELVLNAGFSVVIDATCLQAWQRELFFRTAQRLRVPCSIIDFDVELASLRSRIVERQQRGGDASEATLEVLEQQIATREPLSAAEREFIDTRYSHR